MCLESWNCSQYDNNTNNSSSNLRMRRIKKPAIHRKSVGKIIRNRNESLSSFLCDSSSTVFMGSILIPFFVGLRAPMHSIPNSKGLPLTYSERNDDTEKKLRAVEL